MGHTPLLRSTRDTSEFLELRYHYPGKILPGSERGALNPIIFTGSLPPLTPQSTITASSLVL